MQYQRDEKERAVAEQRNKVKVKENAAAAAADTCLVIVSQFDITPARTTKHLVLHLVLIHMKMVNVECDGQKKRV